MAVEMKSKSWKAEEVRRQLQAGALLAESAVPQGAAPQFLPVLLVRATESRMEYTQLQKCRITFKGRHFTIILERCGASLDQILDRYATPPARDGPRLPDDNLHAPNEKFHVPNPWHGMETVARFLEKAGT